MLISPDEEDAVKVRFIIALLVSVLLVMLTAGVAFAQSAEAVLD